MTTTTAPLELPGDVVYNGRHYSATPLGHPLFRAARTQPGSIDSLLREHLHQESFPKELELYVRDYVNVEQTPGLYGDASMNRPQWYYANALIKGMLLGRAFHLLSTPVRPPLSLSDVSEFPFSRLPAELRLEIWAYYKADLLQRQKYWDIMTRVFIKALWSGREPEEGARYMTGIILLCCGHALSTTASSLQGRGSKWVWWEDRIADPERTWGWDELTAAVMATAELPRSNTDIEGLRRRWEDTRDDFSENVERMNNWLETGEYVSRQTLTVLDLAREHLKTDERDWTPPELAVKFLSPLYEGVDEAKAIWQETGFVPRAYEERLGVPIDDGGSLFR